MRPLADHRISLCSLWIFGTLKSCILSADERCVFFSIQIKPILGGYTPLRVRFIMLQIESMLHGFCHIHQHLFSFIFPKKFYTQILNVSSNKSSKNAGVFPRFPEAEWANIKPIRSRSHARWARSITTLVPIWHLGGCRLGGMSFGFCGPWPSLCMGIYSMCAFLGGAIFETVPLVFNGVIWWDALWLKGHLVFSYLLWEGDVFFFWQGFNQFWGISRLYT